ncbi:hypothetical protein [Pseudohoeflea coraliihabitans]|uniref:Uncharacterized protein n=1 Tax=Pseudohoeflea coraliihabitans TaxID=2860393 RepID=A0ABS6WMG5_9HYPH|nr:hypothetical protein [Pseudohoeflea sp. DP4N28-3]MBW3097138.1 hypothetical protein [Pseudohoeflea sp. DP4N28-3]
MTREFDRKTARQGSPTGRILLVLVGSLAAAAIVWIAAEVYYNAALEPEVEESVATGAPSPAVAE